MKNNIAKTIKPMLVKHEPEILMSMGLVGMVFSTVWTVKATINAVRLIDKKKQELNVDKLTFKDTLKTVWKQYIPTVASTAISIPCIIAGNRVSSKRNAALATAYTLSETALQEYQTKTKEIVGEKKEQEIHEAISKDKVEKTYDASKILLTGDGDSLFFEPITGRYFKSNWNKILKAANELNADALGGNDEVTLNDWFDAIGLPPTKGNDYMGWSTMRGRQGLIDIQIDSSLTPDNVPCGAIYYVNEPILLNQ